MMGRAFILVSASPEGALPRKGKLLSLNRPGGEWAL